ncbi:unnamed protein product [Brassica rapa subsp. narinosa]
MRGRSTNTNCCRCWFAVTDDLEKQGHTPPSEREGREASQPKDRYEKKLRWELRRNSSTVFLFTLPPWIYLTSEKRIHTKFKSREKDISIHDERSKERQNERGN